jgi:hypothetical protein
VEPAFPDPSDVSVALADHPDLPAGISAGHEAPYRRSEAGALPYRRPAATLERTGLSDTGSWNAFTPHGQTGTEPDRGSAAPDRGFVAPDQGVVASDRHVLTGGSEMADRAGGDGSRPRTADGLRPLEIRQGSEGGWSTGEMSRVAGRWDIDDRTARSDQSRSDQSRSDQYRSDLSRSDFSRSSGVARAAWESDLSGGVGAPERPAPWESGLLPPTQAERQGWGTDNGWEAPATRQPAPEPEYGPAPPATNGRTAFGFTAGPISGNWQDDASTLPAPKPSPSSQGRTGEHTTHRAAPDRSRHQAVPISAEDEHIGDLVGNNAHEIRPHRAGAVQAQPRRSRGVVIAGVVLTLSVIVGGTVAGVAYFAGDDKDVTSVREPGAKPQPEEARTATALIEGRAAAEFELISAVTKVTVRNEDLGDNLYRMSTAEGSGLLPKPELTRDKVQLQLAPNGSAGDVVGDTGQVEVVLSSKVEWTLRFSGAAEEQVLDLQGGKVGGIDFTGEVRRTTIQLPKAAGTVPLKVTGAVEELAMTSPNGNPVRVEMKGGAKTVAAGKRTLRDVAPGSTLTPKDWATDNRYDVDTEAQVTLLSVDTRD